MIVFLWLIGTLIVATLTGVLASSKHRSAAGWFFSSLLVCTVLSPLVGLLVLLTLGFMPALPAKK